MPSLSSVHTRSTCCLLVSGCFTEIAQQIHSLRARGVRSSHEALASASEARVFRKSSGNAWTTPPESSLLVRVIHLSYYKIASLARMAGASGCTSFFCRGGGSQRGEKEVEWARPCVWLARQEQACARPPRGSNGSSF